MSLKDQFIASVPHLPFIRGKFHLSLCSILSISLSCLIYCYFLPVLYPKIQSYSLVFTPGQLCKEMPVLFFASWSFQDTPSVVHKNKFITSYYILDVVEVSSNHRTVVPWDMGQLEECVIIMYEDKQLYFWLHKLKGLIL